MNIYGKQHDCFDLGCIASGLYREDRVHISECIDAIMMADPEAKYLEPAVFHDDDNNFYVVILANYANRRFVVGAIYTPTLYEELTAIGLAELGPVKLDDKTDERIS